jgi:hypothetical protein
MIALCGSDEFLKREPIIAYTPSFANNPFEKQRDSPLSNLAFRQVLIVSEATLYVSG